MPTLHAFREAVQSNKVYLPRMSSSPCSSCAARQINAIRWAATGHAAPVVGFAFNRSVL